MNTYLLWVDKYSNDEVSWELAGTFPSNDDAELEGICNYSESHYWFVEEVNE